MYFRKKYIIKLWETNSETVENYFAKIGFQIEIIRLKIRRFYFFPNNLYLNNSK